MENEIEENKIDEEEVAKVITLSILVCCVFFTFPFKKMQRLHYILISVHMKYFATFYLFYF